jgi:hypothetical protein
MSIHALAIHPADPDYIPKADFVESLRGCGFLGESFDLFGTTCYRPGEKFFNLIDFKSSHSIIELTPTKEGFIESEPHDSRLSCDIELETDEVPCISCGCNFQDPRCPTCTSLLTIEEFHHLMDIWFSSREPWLCSSCGSQVDASDLDYQHTAGIARYWIKIEQIYEGEAKPTQAFLQLLAQATAYEWRYFWYHL